MAPARIVQTRGGWPFFEVDVTAARANPQDVATIAAAPAAGRGGRRGGAPPAGAAGRGGRAGGAPPAGRGGRGGAAPAVTVTAEKLGDGLYRLTTGAGSYDSLIVEFQDHIMMLEAGANEAGTLAYIAEAKRLIPNKPIRYVMNTHAHSDHTRGLPAMVAEGATIITHENNREFFERALNTPRMLLDDVLARNPYRTAVVDPVGDRKVYSDGTRTVEMHRAWPVPHSNGLLVAYFPKERILFQGDFSLPAPGEPANDHVQALGEVVRKLNLNFERYINVHTSEAPQTRAEFDAAVEARRQADAKAK
jgi:glyoxylase-like metal-dependent hydrolase (beta-lactamase superfamily II)